MESIQKIILNWSGGKDATMALYYLLYKNPNAIMGLLTSISLPQNRISMHGVRAELLELQTKSLGLPLYKMELPEMPSMETYENNTRTILTDLKNKGATHMAYGDIFLEDLKIYREQLLAPLGLSPVFPLWKIPTQQLLHDFINKGFKSIICCVNDQYLDKSFVGRIIDENFINDLPPNVDCCGENGEYHSFVFDGPIFKNPIHFKKGELVYKEYPAPEKDKKNGFWYIDLLPVY